MKYFKYLLGAIYLSFFLLACSSNKEDSTTITIGASPEPHATILEQVKKNLAKDGYTLKILVFNDYVTPNIALTDGKIDANYTQGQPFLDLYDKDHHANLVRLVAMHIEPMGAYLSNNNVNYNSHKIPSGFKVGIPNEPTSETRALKILENNGIISLNNHENLITINNVKANPYNIKLIPLDPAILPRALKSKQLDMALINSNYAIANGYIPGTNSVFLENKNTPYVNIIAIRQNEINDKKIQALAKAATESNVKSFIEEKYKGSIISAF